MYKLYIFIYLFHYTKINKFLIFQIQIIIQNAISLIVLII